MDKNAIKKYAVWAREELISRVSQKALQFGIFPESASDPESAPDPDADSFNGSLFTGTEKNQRRALIRRVEEAGYQQVMEEVAYTWFNRFAALRFMEVNGYLPSHIRVFTDEQGNFKPQILTEAIHLSLDGLEMEKVYRLKSENRDDELYKYLIITQCNALNRILPGMFQQISDYTELLFPDYILREGSVIHRLVTDIPESDWQQQVQIIGWLYQYYNSEPKDKVFADLKRNIKISKENIPAATQLFTPDWIVQYMVQNSLGRLWLSGHPDDALQCSWQYYLDEAPQTESVAETLTQQRKQYAAITPEQILCVDPCAGSGHILCCFFDVLMQIYTSYGVSTHTAVISILQHNLWGVDIDDRAAQLAYFAVMMKARQYDRRIFSTGIQPHVYAIKESNHVSPAAVAYFENGSPELTSAMDTILAELQDAKEYGSILTLTPQNFPLLHRRFDEIRDTADLYRDAALAELEPLVNTAEALAQQYHAVVTNPPYMGASGMGAKLSEYVKKNYPDSKSDLFAVFMERCGKLTAPDGYQAMITQHAWMFLSSFEKLRGRLLQRETINMAHLGARAFEEIGGEVVQTTAFVLQQSHTPGYKGTYCRLIEPTTQSGKEEMFLSGLNRYTACQDNFSKIPGSPVAYWVSEKMMRAFEVGQAMKTLATPKQGMSTCDVDRFVKLWHEVNINRTNLQNTKNHSRWVRYNKGGEFRRWYGNRDSVVLWNGTGDLLSANKATLRNKDSYFDDFIAWTKISSASTGFRIFEKDFLFDGAGGSLFVNSEEMKLYYIGFLNSKPCSVALNIISPTMNFNESHIGSLPVIIDISKKDNIDSLVTENITLSRTDWDSFETSWDFQRHPLLPQNGETTIAAAFTRWQTDCHSRFARLKHNEEELNRIFIDIYGLQDELTPDEEDKDVTVRRADLPRDVRSFISYAVGCMFGRYSLDMPGLAYAGGEWNSTKYRTFTPDSDGILPICDDEYFDDDIVSRFVRFVETVFGTDTLEENLRFIADALGGKGASRQVLRSYFINDFYQDHLKIYQKRPIYWLFDSGKKNGFKCLIYMHRYQPDTIARIRTDYLHQQQSRYRTAMEDVEHRMESADTSARVKLAKQLAALQGQAREAAAYEEKIHHLADMMISINLDDGVKHNYAIFEDVLAKIK